MNDLRKKGENDWFFNRVGNSPDPFDKIDNMLDHPVRSFAKIAGLALVMHILFYGVIILMIVLGIKWVF